MYPNIRLYKLEKRIRKSLEFFLNASLGVQNDQIKEKMIVRSSSALRYVYAK